MDARDLDRHITGNYGEDYFLGSCDLCGAKTSEIHFLSHDDGCPGGGCRCDNNVCEEHCLDCN